MSSIIQEIQQDIIEESVSLSSILRKFFLVVKKLELQEFENWIESELNGYDDKNKNL